MISESEKARLMIGFKQVKRALSEGKAEKVFLSEDCETKISAPIEELAKENSVQLLYIATMKELGALCGINVKASCAVVLKA